MAFSDVLEALVQKQLWECFSACCIFACYFSTLPSSNQSEQMAARIGVTAAVGIICFAFESSMAGESHHPLLLVNSKLSSVRRCWKLFCACVQFSASSSLFVLICQVTNMSLFFDLVIFAYCFGTGTPQRPQALRRKPLQLPPAVHSRALVHPASARPVPNRGSAAHIISAFSGVDFRQGLHGVRAGTGLHHPVLCSAQNFLCR